FLGVALVGEPLSKRIVLGTILAILAFMGGMAIAITAAPSARTKAQRDALLVEAKRRKLGGLDVAATRKRLAELEREGATIEGEMEESRMLVRVDTSNDEADEPEEHRVVDDDAGARR
ncbi:MAG TPA: hypothetical protein VF407_04320, partial [Polyangiaceae bacterium]